MRNLNDREIIGKRIAEIRKKKGYSQTKLADLLKMNQRNLTNIETGKTAPGSIYFLK